MTRLIALAAVVAAAFAVFYLSARTPSPIPASAPATTFSAARAMIDIAAMAPAPHPIGSDANHRVRDYLVRRMAALGLAPQIQHDESSETRTFGDETYISGGDVENVIGVLPGRDRRLRALTLMAHYDSVPGSPGAADDITGVASIIEIVRAIEAGGRPARDILVVITDGEEAGLLGARAFFADNPLAARVGFVLNLETRGGGGRANMFETGPANGQTIELFRRTAVRPLANSLTVFVYKLLPNDTDYTVARKHGVPGLNYAFIGRQFDYHSPSSTVAALDQGSVQHIGDEVLGTARALALSPALPSRAPDAVYGEPVGDWLVAYPTWGGWIVLGAAVIALAIAVRRARREAPWPGAGVAAGFAASFLILVGSALLLDAARTATGVASGWMEYRPLLARFPFFEIALALVGLGTLLIAAATAALWRRREAGVAGVWTGLLATGVLAALILQLIAPTTDFVVAWPVTAGTVCAAITAMASGRRPIGWTVSLGITVLTLAWLGALFHGLLEGLDRADACAVVVWLAAMVAMPLASPPEGWRRRYLTVGLALVGLGCGGALWLNFTNPWTPRHPRAVMPLYVVDQAAGKAWRASPLPVDAWTRRVLTADGGVIEKRTFPGYAGPLNVASARPVDDSAPPVSITRAADGGVAVRAPMSAGAILMLDVRSDVPVAATALNGRPEALLIHPGRWTHLRWQAAQDVSVYFRPASPGALDVRWAEVLDHWPAQARPLPAMPAELMAWDLAGSTVVVGAKRFAWEH